MASQQLVEHRAKAINIGEAADGRVITYCLFRRHVTGRAQHFHRARDGALRLDQSCQSEVREVWFTFLVEQDVSRFDVAMKNVVLMSVINGARHLCDYFYCPPD